MKKKKLHVRSVRVQLLGRIAIALWSLWLLCMVLLTVGTAQFILEELTKESYEFPHYTANSGNLDDYYPTDEGTVRPEHMNLPGAVDYCMLKSITTTDVFISSPAMAETLFRGIYRTVWPDSNTAVLFLDGEGNIAHQTGEFLYFDYSVTDIWGVTQRADGYAWIDLSDRADERFTLLRQQYTGSPYLFMWDTACMTGWFDGSRFEPLYLAVTDGRDIQTGADADNPNSVIWHEHFDLTANAPSGKELVTIYIHQPTLRLSESQPVRYQGQRYDDLVTLLQEEGYYYNTDGRIHQSRSQRSLFNSVFFGVRSFWDLSGYDFTSNLPWPDPALTMVTAFQASPLRIAMDYLLIVYLLTATLVLVIFLVIHRTVKRHLTAPLQEINRAISNGWHHLPTLRNQPSAWEDVQELTGHYLATQQKLSADKTELARLSAAVGYAKTAEGNRRQMTSHIAHELKTPLAVIHSYTEALQERIAEEKRDQYLSVILSETERMDGMVLEMLDLSRLEAGRVKLAQDEFSLLEMTRDIFARLDMALQAKKLHVSYQCYYNSIVTADESRIRQVIENFATNAVKHTPTGGEIRVHIYTNGDGTIFSMENDGENLPANVLDKVWDSFWRQDESRTSPGTGLGLAIAKGIITLHGGTCAAYNTNRGVEFRFRI